MKPVSQLLYDGYQFQLRRQYEEAARIYRKILRNEPRNADVMVLLGIVRDKQMKHAEAVELFDKAIKLKPDIAQAHHNRGLALCRCDRFEEAATSFLRAYELRPELPQAFSEHARALRSICDWRTFDSLERQLREFVRGQKVIVNPFTFMQFADDPAEQFACARTYMTRYVVPEPVPQRMRRRVRPAGARIRIAYLSGDFRNHPTSHLIAGLIENHDRNRFEVIGISAGMNDDTPVRARMQAAFDKFIDAWEMPSDELVSVIYQADVDILLDLNAHTDLSRTEVLAARPAPIQVNYLGYPGTIGTNCADYILVDPFAAPAELQPYFSEKFAYLPDCYQPNDAKRPIGKRAPTRAESGLPEQGFVFCCFNNNFKMTPRMFEIWMRLLNKVPGSVMWLMKDKDIVELNLRREAAARGVDPARLAFAPRVSLAEHLARHRHADLFLDTLPYNAHTTASDALWTDLPIVTCAGKAFPARVAGSLLGAIGLPELVTKNLEEYESLACSLATEPQRLRDMRERLARNRLQNPLFDFDRYRRHIEAAYETMVEIERHGERPKSFAVEPIGRPA